jgi:hypothetical protein
MLTTRGRRPPAPASPDRGHHVAVPGAARRMREVCVNTDWRLTAVLAILLACVHVDAQEAALERKAVLGGKVSVLVPHDFMPMSQEMLNVKYPSSNRPSLVYTNPRASINIALDHKAMSLPADQLAAAHQSVASAMKNLYPSAQWFRNEIRTINGRQFFLVDLRTPAIDTEVRNIILGTSLDDRLLLISFNVTRALEKDWMPTGYKIVESIVVK